jgi:hypothetical protein
VALIGARAARFCICRKFIARVWAKRRRRWATGTPHSMDMAVRTS